MPLFLTHFPQETLVVNNDISNIDKEQVNKLYNCPQVSKNAGRELCSGFQTFRNI